MKINVLHEVTSQNFKIERQGWQIQGPFLPLLSSVQSTISFSFLLEIFPFVKNEILHSVIHFRNVHLLVSLQGNSTLVFLSCFMSIKDTEQNSQLHWGGVQSTCPLLGENKPIKSSPALSSTDLLRTPKESWGSAIGLLPSLPSAQF